MVKIMDFHLESFLEMISVERGLSDRTIEAYQNDLKDFEDFLGKRKKIHEAGEKVINNYIKNLAKKKLSTSSISRKISSIKQFYNFLYNEKYRSDDPSISLEAPKKQKKLPRNISESEVESLFFEAEKLDGPEGSRARVMLEIL